MGAANYRATFLKIDKIGVNDAFCTIFQLIGKSVKIWKYEFVFEHAC